MTKKIDEKNLAYYKTSINDLILFAVYSVISSKEDCGFEKLVNESFMLFPHVFGFLKYPQWPDTRKLDRPLRSLRSCRLITGSPKNNFLLTKEGKEKAESVAKTLRQGKLL
ncbi:hypothetical protein KKG36_00675 [Patescibacteria group bacterium]|nr:hypothetical protein [Patescibacteria group bacterium]